jgi:hypothetical protein
VDYNLGLSLSEDADSIWATLADVEKVRVMTTIVTEDPSWLNGSGQVPAVGGHVTHEDTWINFIRREVTTAAPVSGGTFQDFASEVHIKGSLLGLVHVSEHYSASGAATGLTQIQIAGMQSSGGLAPIVWDTTAAYENGV